MYVHEMSHHTEHALFAMEPLGPRCENGFFGFLNFWYSFEWWYWSTCFHLEPQFPSKMHKRVLLDIIFESRDASIVTEVFVGGDREPQQQAKLHMVTSSSQAIRMLPWAIAIMILAISSCSSLTRTLQPQAYCFLLIAR
jgi:hypothetical protein